MAFQVNNLVKEVREFCDASVNSKNPPTYSIYELGTTTVSKKLNCKFCYSKADMGFKYIDNGNPGLGVFYTNDAIEVADSIGRSSYYGNHRDVKKDKDWLKLCDCQLQPMAGKFGSNWDKLYLDVIPCYYCGLGLPLNLIEVDHWFEQEKHQSGAIQAILKVFRASKHTLTLGAATGKKGLQYEAILTGKVATIATRASLLNKGTTWNYSLNNLREDLVDKKRQLSVNGLIMLSILYHATEDSITVLDSFYQMFMNHCINLVPACPNCNKLKNHR
jgi:hypothetical protein